MKKIPLITTTTIVSLLLIVPLPARESWPVAPPDVQERLKSYDQHEQEVQQAIKPELEQWAKKGKPYIPWAAKPEDLPQASIPAFVGAEGGGKFSFGGRGGKIYVVTSLEDSGPGTLREACEAAGPRIVVFNVAGIIHLKMPIFIEAPYITIAGQSAPGDGICIADQGIIDNAHDVVIRYIRLRRGVQDIFNRHGGHYGNPIGNIILDHISASWGNDQNLDTYRHMYQPPEGGPARKLPTVNVTIQWCITSEALNTWNHAFGGDWGGRNTLFHHNLFASNTGRNPSIAMSYDFNFVNNVLFNWRHRSVDGGDQNSRINVINNYYKPGPATPDSAVRYRIVQPAQSWSKADPVSKWGKVYAAGNVVEGYPKVTADNWDGGVQFAKSPDPDASGGIANGAVNDENAGQQIIAKVRSDQPLPMPALKLQSAQEAYEAVLADAGASLPRRDAVDERVVATVRSGKTWSMGTETSVESMKGLAKNNTGTAGNGLITEVSQVGGYPQYAGTPYKDSDHDGIPDDWETAHGLNPNDPSDAAKDSGDGYMWIEKFLDDVVATKKAGRESAAVPASAAVLASGAIPPAAAISPEEQKYTQAIEQRTADILALLILEDPAKKSAVHDILINQYRALRDWHDANDAKLKDKNASEEDKSKVRASLKELHDGFVAKLNQNLSPEQVEKVKDKMVYGKVQVTMAAYEQIAGPLSEEQKTTILKYLKDAREEATDGGSAEEKSAIFKKYKGKINNYLSQQGIDMKKKEKEWGQREKQGAAATKPNANP